MPVAIVVLPDTIPAIFSETDDARLVARLGTLKGAPALADVADARAWLASLALPSGWFADEAAARAFVAQCKAPETMTPSVFAHIREESGMTREAFGAALGYAGNSNTRHKQVLQMERGEKPILAEKAVRARAIAIEALISTMKDQMKMMEERAAEFAAASREHHLKAKEILGRGRFGRSEEVQSANPISKDLQSTSAGAPASKRAE